MVTIGSAGAAAHLTECWLRQQGLPFFVARRARGRLLIARITPLLVMVLALHLGGWLLSRPALTFALDGPMAVGVLALLITVVGVTLVGVTVSAFVFTARLLRRRPEAMRVIGVLVLCYFVMVDPWLSEAPIVGTEGVRLPLAAEVADLLVVVIALLATWAGVGSLVSWSVRTSIRRLGTLGEMSSRALPLLMLVVFFSFFAPAVWAVTNSMSALRLLGVIGFFALLGLLFIVPVTRSELVGVDDRIDADERAELVDGTTLTALIATSAAPGAPLSRAERFNLHVVLVLAQVLQVAIFSALVSAFLIGLGEIALSPDVLASWLGAAATHVQLFGMTLGVDVALVKTAVFLSCVSSLNFLVSATNNAAYKSAFYDPLFHDARVALAVRSAYRAGKPC